MPNYYSNNSDTSDLNPTWPNTTTTNWAINKTQGGQSNSEVISLTNSQTKSGSYITDAGLPNSDAWETTGSWTVKMETGTGGHNMNIRGRVRCVRLNSSGSILQSGTFTSYQTFGNSATIYTFTPGNVAWTAGEEDCTNRLAIETEYNNTDTMNQSVTINHYLFSVATVATNITENNGTCTVSFIPKTVIF
jgi:hypothetical protein